MSDYVPRVLYWNKISGAKKKSKVSAPCFSQYGYESLKAKIEKIYYKCSLDKNLSTDEINFYIKFLKKLLPKNSFKSKIIDKKTHCLFILDTNSFQNSKKTKILTTLTLFRYLCEFPEVISDCFKNKKKNFEDIFQQFQLSHGVQLVKYPYGLSGHAIRSEYSKVESITFSDFQKNWESGKNSVSGYFA